MIKYYKLFDLLQRRGIRVIDLAGQTKTSQATFAKMRKGQNINTDVICKICAALNVQPSDIMEYIPEAPTDQE